MLKLNIENTKEFISTKDLDSMNDKVIKSFNTLLSKNGLGNDFLGWIDLPNEINVSNIYETAQEIRSKSDVLVVIGIGGSYLGAAAVIEAHKNYFKNDYEVIFAGNSLSTDYLYDLEEYLQDKNFCINVISKSGTTTEPAIAFRVLKKMLEDKYGLNHGRIYATTDKEKGSLKVLANNEGYKTFDIDDNIGGRFSVLSAVGLLPIACAGIDVFKFVQGAIDAKNKYSTTTNNDVLDYVLTRNLLHLNKDIEILVNYEPKLSLFSEWWKQLFGESEGKDGKGIYVSSATFSTDLHSMGQMIQDGKRNLFETVIKVNKYHKQVLIPTDDKNLDNLNYLAGKSLEYVNSKALEGTLLAHIDGNVPNIIIELDEISAYTIGELIYFFELACGVSGYVLGVNPFDQPGVESYKRNMFALLGKEGYSHLKEELEKKMK